MLPEDYGIENFIKQKNGRCLNSKPYFKYWIPKKTYDLFEVAWIHNRWEIEFYTLNQDYKEIWSEFRNSSKYGPCKLNSIGYDENYHCYVVDIMAMEFMEHYMKECYSPFRYMGEEVYINHAHNMGYHNDKEIKADWIDYHNKVGSQFIELGLLPKESISKIPNNKQEKKNNRRILYYD